MLLFRHFAYLFTHKGECVSRLMGGYIASRLSFFISNSPHHFSKLCHERVIQFFPFHSESCELSNASISAIPTICPPCSSAPPQISKVAASNDTLETCAIRSVEPNAIWLVLQTSRST